MDAYLQKKTAREPGGVDLTSSSGHKPRSTSLIGKNIAKTIR
jgi:hypothetical protein